ncbi:uncharacterized protein Fot_42837 [Forsythia ovata]|uniref:Uncharacterized protein n=1 Tax=Forsythia ovata TaxID=205694 RepID=A0ABD1RMB7_9LAMI
MALFKNQLSLQGGEQGENSQNAGTHGNDGQDLDAITESLSELMLLTSQMITEQGTESLSQLASQLEGHPSVTDPLERSLFQNLGALLLELGRTITALQMSQTPPLPSLEEESFGANSLRTVEHGSGLSGGSPASGSLPRNMGIRIRTDSLLLQREPTSSQPQGQGFPLPPDGNSDQRDAAGLDPNSSTGVSQSQDVSSSHGAAATVSDEGIFLSNILHQIMPLISENIGAESSCEGANSVETQADDNQNPGASSRLWRGPESQPSSKRHRR